MNIRVRGEYGGLPSMRNASFPITSVDIVDFVYSDHGKLRSLTVI